MKRSFIAAEKTISVFKPHKSFNCTFEKEIGVIPLRTEEKDANDGRRQMKKKTFFPFVQKCNCEGGYSIGQREKM